MDYCKPMGKIQSTLTGSVYAGCSTFLFLDLNAGVMGVLILLEFIKLYTYVLVSICFHVISYHIILYHIISYSMD